VLPALYLLEEAIADLKLFDLPAKVVPKCSAKGTLPVSEPYFPDCIVEPRTGFVGVYLDKVGEE